MSLQQLLGLFDQLQDQIQQIERRIAPMENARVQPFQRMIIGRISGETTSSGASGTRLYKITEQEVSSGAGTISGDKPFIYDPVRGHDRDGRPQPHAQDCVIMEFDHFRTILPQPNRLICVRDEGGGTDIGDRMGKEVDIGSTGGSSAPPFQGLIPMVPGVDASLYHGGEFPWASGAIYPAMLCETLSSGGLIDGQFYIVFPPNPPGDTTHTFSASTVVTATGSTIKVEIDTDPAGRVKDVRLTEV